MIVSLMGGDINLGFMINSGIKASSLLFWHCLIVKSKSIQDSIGIKKCKIIPNGVNISLFKPVDRKFALKNMDWDARKKHILFAANPSRLVKNYQLLEKAYTMQNSLDKIKLHALEKRSP